MKLATRQVALWLGLIVGVCYFGSLHGSFHFDDSHSIESNLAIRSLSSIPSLWTDPRTSSFIPENRVYRPLVYTFYTFCWLLGGGKTWPFHLMKMAMHVLVALALFLIWRRLWSIPGWLPVKGLKLKLPMFSQPFQLNADWAAFFLAVLFAIHPAGSECVAYIAATTSLQCALFYLWGFYAYMLFRDTGDKRYFLGSLGLYFLSMASKEEGVTLLAVIMLYEFFLRAEEELIPRAWSSFRAGIPHLITGVALFAWWMYMNPKEGLESHGYATPWTYFMTQWRAYLWYMRLWFWPWHLNADEASMEFSSSIADPLAIQALIGNCLIVLFAWLQRKRFPALAFGLAWFYVTIAPASSVVPLAEAINEHRMYLAYVGFVGGTFSVLLWCGENFFAAETRSRRLGYWYAAIALGLLIGTQERIRVWENDENLWADTVEKNPTSGRALNNLALVYLGRGEYQKAIDNLDKCEQYWSTYMYCPLNKGIALQALKKPDEAEKSFMRAYQLNPRNVHVNFHLGRFYQEHKKDDEKAIFFLRASVELTGGRYPAADIFLSMSYANLKRYDDARAVLKRALGVEPTNTVAMFELGRVESEAGNLAAAADAYGKLVDTDPRSIQGWYNLGVAKLALHDYAAARGAFGKTVELDPKSEQGWYNLAFAAERTRDVNGMITAVRKLASINPSKPEYQSRLAEIEKRYGAGRN